MYSKLLLASSSKPRQALLEEAKIPFELIKQDADEHEVDQTLPLEKRVLAIAQHKMNHAQLPAGKEGDVVVVLTADTMGNGTDGVVHGKANDYDDAVAKVKGLTDPYITATGFCLEKKAFKDGQWSTIQKVEKVVSATYSFIIPDHWIERYLKYSWGLNASGSIAIENYGEQFLKTINGSYTTVKGLPMFELREALEEVGFF